MQSLLPQRPSLLLPLFTLLYPHHTLSITFIFSPTCYQTPFHFLLFLALFAAHLSGAGSVGMVWKIDHAYVFVVWPSNEARNHFAFELQLVGVMESLQVGDLVVRGALKAR